MTMCKRDADVYLNGPAGLSTVRRCGPATFFLLCLGLAVVPAASLVGCGAQDSSIQRVRLRASAQGSPEGSLEIVRVTLDGPRGTAEHYEQGAPITVIRAVVGDSITAYVSGFSPSTSTVAEGQDELVFTLDPDVPHARLVRREGHEEWHATVSRGVPKPEGGLDHAVVDELAWRGSELSIPVPQGLYTTVWLRKTPAGVPVPDSIPLAAGQEVHVGFLPWTSVRAWVESPIQGILAQATARFDLSVPSGLRGDALSATVFNFPSLSVLATEEESPWSFACPDVPLHVFIEGADWMAYGQAIPGEKEVLGVRARVQLCGPPVVDRSPIVDDADLYPGRLDVGTVQWVDGLRQASMLRVRLDGDVTAVEFLDVPVATLVHATRGVAYLERNSAGLYVAAAWEPGSIVIQDGRGREVSGQVSLVPRLADIPGVIQGGTGQPLTLQVRGTGRWAASGLPLGIYDVRVDCRISDGGTQRGELSGERRIALTDDAPVYVFRVSDGPSTAGAKSAAR